MKIYSIVWFGQYGNPNFDTSDCFSTLEKAKIEFEKMKTERGPHCPDESYYDNVVSRKDFYNEECEILSIYENWAIYEITVL